MGVHKVVKALYQRFWWPCLQLDTRNFVCGCAVCQRAKDPTQAPPGQLAPLPIPDRWFETWTMDFITELPDHQHCNGIFVCVEKLTKLVRLIACSLEGGSLSAQEAARLFFQHVVRIYGVHKFIIHDRDPRFTGHFWQALFAIVGSRLLFGSAYRPQTDGQLEQMNKIIAQVLHTMAVNVDSKWVDKLSYVEFAVNQSVNNSTGTSPFELVYGQPVAVMVDRLDSHHPNEAAQEMVADVLQLVAMANQR